MKNTFILNIVHRPELNPEYAEKAGGDKNGKADNNESLDIFKFQQDTAHKNGLKTTIQMTYASLFSDEIVELVKKYHEEYNDEIALSLLGLPCPEFKKKYKTEEFCIWLFSKEEKKMIIDDVFSLFYEKFGFYPSSTGSYYLDAYCINYIKEKYPSVTCAIATCWEEGLKAYHTCNNSWYTFLDGGPWNPWIPSKHNTHCIASNEDDDSGIVAIPHLSRDLIACFDGNGSNFGTHPQNVIRGMIYKDNEIPYLYNLIDQYRHLAKYNNGYSYNMMFVGPGWLNKLGRWEAPYEFLKKSYEDGMAYYGKLKKENKLIDMTMEEFASFYRKNKKYGEPEVALWKDLLYGSNKQYFWYADPYFRTCLDMNQSGAMIDLRPYVAKLDWEVGVGTDHIYDAGYPYLIQANYRAGYFTHYAGSGTVKSCKVRYKGKEVDLCLCRSLAKYSKVGKDIKLTLNPVTVSFTNLDVEIETSYIFKRNKGEIETVRKIINDLHGEEIELIEYFTGAYGVNEYQEDMSKIILSVDEQSLTYSYRDREINKDNVNFVKANIPYVNTEVIMYGDNDKGMVKEGIAFSPVYKLSLTKKLNKGEMHTWLKVKKAN